MASKTINNAIKEVRELFNEVRSNLSCEEIKRIRKKRLGIEAVYNVLGEEQKGSLTSRQETMLRDGERYLKNISKHLKNLKKHFKKYQYGIDYLFNEHNEGDYTSNNDINAFNEVRKLFNEVRSHLSCEVINRIRIKLRIEAAKVLKQEEQKGSLTSRQQNILRDNEKYLTNITKHLKNLKKHFKKNQYGIDYLFNEHYLKTIPQIMIFMRLESFLMNVEVMFYLKKQRKLEKNSIKRGCL